MNVKHILKDNYLTGFIEVVKAGDYDFVWVKSMELKELVYSSLRLTGKIFINALQ